MINIKKFISPFFLLISFLILIYTFYKSEIVWNGEKHNYYYQYYFASLILIFLSIVSFYLKSKIKINISIIIISTLLTLYCLEAFLIFQNKTFIFWRPIILISVSWRHKILIFTSSRHIYCPFRVRNWCAHALRGLFSPKIATLYCLNTKYRMLVVSTQI